MDLRIKVLFWLAIGFLYTIWYVTWQGCLSVGMPMIKSFVLATLTVGSVELCSVLFMAIIIGYYVGIETFFGDIANGIDMLPSGKKLQAVMLIALIIFYPFTTLIDFVDKEFRKRDLYRRIKVQWKGLSELVIQHRQIILGLLGVGIILWGMHIFGTLLLAIKVLITFLCCLLLAAAAALITCVYRRCCLNSDDISLDTMDKYTQK